MTRQPMTTELYGKTSKVWSALASCGACGECLPLLSNAHNDTTCDSMRTVTTRARQAREVRARPPHRAKPTSNNGCERRLEGLSECAHTQVTYRGQCVTRHVHTLACFEDREHKSRSCPHVMSRRKCWVRIPCHPSDWGGQPSGLRMHTYDGHAKQRGACGHAAWDGRTTRERDDERWWRAVAHKPRGVTVVPVGSGRGAQD